MPSPTARLPLATAASLVLLAGCASGPPVDSELPGAPSSRFAPQSILPAVAKQLPASTGVPSFGRLVITTRTNAEQAGGRKEAWKSVMTLFDAGNGLVETTTELSSGDIAYGRVRSLSYRGLVDLRWQNQKLGTSAASPIYEVKEAKRFDALPSGGDQEFSFEFRSGAEAQATDVQTSQRRCKTGRALPASQLHPKLPGQATELSCVQISNTGAPNASRWMLLQDYGVAILLESKIGSRKVEVQVVDVNS